MKRHLALTIGLLSTNSWADPAARAAFEGDVDAHVNLIDSQLHASQRDLERAAELRESQTRAERIVESVQSGAWAKSVESANVATLPRLASVAIKTDLDDTEAGVSIAPLVLLGMTYPTARSANLTLASLKDDVLRIGATFEHRWESDAISPEALGMQSCNFNPTTYRNDVLGYVSYYEVLCTQIANAPYPEDPKQTATWVQATASCGIAIPDTIARAKSTLDSGRVVENSEIIVATHQPDLTAKITAVIKLWEALPPAPAAVAATTSTALGKLKEYRDKIPSKWGCITGEALVKAAIRYKWMNRKRSLGFSARADFHPYKFGFNPDANEDPSKNKDLPKGEVAEAELRTEIRHSRRKLTWTAGIGTKWAREGNRGDYTVSARPSAGFQYVVRRLDRGKLEEDGSIALTKDNKLPPHLVVGTDVLIGIPFYHKPKSQTSDLDEVTITLFADFRVTEAIAFRIGIPLKAKLATRKDDTATETNEAKKALQWTVPVFLATVLEI